MVCEASVNSTKNITIDPAFNQVSHNVIKLRGAPNQSAELHLQASESDVVLSFPVNLTNCPPGYVINGSQCVCGVSHYLGLVGCNPDVKLKSGYWIGFCSNTEPSKICTTFCPPGFCSYHKMNPSSDLHPLPNNYTLLDSYICGPKRTGRVCGKCAMDHSVYFHSERYTCGRERLCYLGWLFYILSEVFPLLILFLAILYLNKWKNHFYEMKGDVGMSLHEKGRNKKMPTPRHKVTHNPIPTSLFCFDMLFVCLFVKNALGKANSKTS